MAATTDTLSEGNTKIPEHSRSSRSGTGIHGNGLLGRQLAHYPNTGPRMGYLAIVVLVTVALYYQLYVAGAVAPSIIAHYGISLTYYVYISVVANAVGALSSVLAGMADRWGRANIVVYGLLVAGGLTAFAIPHASSGLEYASLVSLVGFIEGIILVATPALVRDFSPQLGRASAMGFWTLGPVVGSLVVSEVSSNTLSHLHAWQDQYTIAGIASLVVFAIAFVALRELSPKLRDQLMVSSRDRTLIEARAKGIDIEESLRHPWRQMLHFDVIASSFAISVFLIIYYTAVGFFVIYFVTIFGFTEKQANGLGNWFWAFDALALVLVGIVSDRLKVRKPFMIIGGIGAVAMTIVFMTKATQPHTTYYDFVVIITLMSVFLGIAYAPWMASFTETVEKRNPALIATGLAVWGSTIRGVIAITFLVFPLVLSSVSPLVTYGAKVSTYATKYASELATIAVIKPATLGALEVNPKNSAAIGQAVSQISAGQHVTSAQAIKNLIAVSTVPKPALAYLQAHGNAVKAAAKESPGQWQQWWWICIGAEAVFLPLVLVMAGRWRPKDARRDADEHEKMVLREMAKLASPSPIPIPAAGAVSGATA